ncbi:MAG: SGNH/GDSL hydrolase family protein [Oceanicaulis sp.]|nr:SGNH/GDSL hydrolase family protein [Oceanicaulis sp.]
MSKQSKLELEKAAIKNYLLPFLNLHKQHPFLPGAQNIKGQSAFIGIEESELGEFRQGYQKVCKTAALDLLKEDEVIENISKLPFNSTDAVMVVGDSHADDLQGWFEIFRHLLEIGVDDASFKVLNNAVYGSTSVDVLRRIDRDLSLAKPEWVIIALGSHDAQMLHGIGDRSLVSLAEFYENISTIESMIQEVTPNPIIWVTPPPAVTELMEDMPMFSGVLYEKKLAPYREVMAGKSGYVVDPMGKRMGRPAEAWNYLPDGFHLSLSGHIETVKWLLRALTSEQK